MNAKSETYLACLDDSYKFEDTAIIRNVFIAEDGRTVITLDKTIFYPQGGGQPCDTGSIQSANGQFDVADVRFLEGKVFHFGCFKEGRLGAGELVRLFISEERRMLNARLHSAGHLIDAAVQNLGLDLKPGKGYHFPDGPYVEYEGKLENIDKDALSKQLQLEVQKLIAANLPISVTVSEEREAEQLCGALPAYLDKSQPIRVVSIGDHCGCPCGGTHVKQLKDLGHMEISKFRTKGDRVKVSYLVQHPDQGGA